MSYFLLVGDSTELFRALKTGGVFLLGASYVLRGHIGTSQVLLFQEGWEVGFLV